LHLKQKNIDYLPPANFLKNDNNFRNWNYTKLFYFPNRRCTNKIYANHNYFFIDFSIKKEVFWEILDINSTY